MKPYSFIEGDFRVCGGLRDDMPVLDYDLLMAAEDPSIGSSWWHNHIHELKDRPDIFAQLPYYRTALLHERGVKQGEGVLFVDVLAQLLMNFTDQELSALAKAPYEVRSAAVEDALEDVKRGQA